MENQNIDPKIIKNQKVVMYAIAYADTFVYAILLWSLVMNQATFTKVNEMIVIFGIGALISTFASFLIIRQASQHQQNFVKTLIYLAIAHIPSVTGLLLSIIFIFSNV
jgi:F0F1-type ATP synthase membrane subunit c/vacuolar-type H+-ATPase subunit K